MTNEDWNTRLYEKMFADHHHFQPSIAAYLLGMRSPTKRYLKCPKCGKRNYCKVIFSEEHCE